MLWILYVLILKNKHKKIYRKKKSTNSMFYDFPNEWTRIMMCWWRIESTSKWNCLYIVCSCVERLHECEVVLCLWLVTSDQVFCKFKLENLWEIDLPCMYLCTSYIHTYAQACNKRGGRGPPRFWQIRRRHQAAAARRITKYRPPRIFDPWCIPELLRDRCL